MNELTPELAFQAIERGVRGILRKNLPPDMILKCVRKVYEGELWFEKNFTQTFLSGRAIKVSDREGQLIQLVSEGLKNKEIASVMSVTEGTVKVYVSRLFDKLGVKDRLDLALFALRNSQSYADAASDPARKSTLESPDDRAEAPATKGPRQPARIFFARNGQWPRYQCAFGKPSA